MGNRNSAIFGVIIFATIYTFYYNYVNTIRLKEPIYKDFESHLSDAATPAVVPSTTSAPLPDLARQLATAAQRQPSSKTRQSAAEPHFSDAATPTVVPSTTSAPLPDLARQVAAAAQRQPSSRTHHSAADKEEFLINTPGCSIPNYGKTLVFKEAKKINITCGERAVFINKLSEDTLVFRIDEKKMKIYAKEKYYECCYKFASRSNITGKEDSKLSYTNCKMFENGTKISLEQEVITVTCVTHKTKNGSRRISYDDAYVFVKKVKQKQHKNNWNILMIGMDTMSRARLLNSMPRTVKYLRNNDWLDFKGYQKVGSNTFPNLIAILTGNKLDTIYRKCNHGMTECNHNFIWSKFNEAGHATAYGEDNLKLPDTFSRFGFRRPPTDHYMRPFFLTGENTNGNLVCAKHKPSAKHQLDYAQDFANTYKNENFFGFFWINSYSHNLNNLPTLFDDEMVAFYEGLRKSGVMNNTFIIFLSDHGIRFGDSRVPVESYYEERLPTFMVWIPHDFRLMHEEKYNNSRLNQMRLVTPYDIYITLGEIMISMSTNSSDIASEACPQCSSIFEKKSESRTCADAGVSEKWCTCHSLTAIDKEDIVAKESLRLAVEYIQNMSKTIQTVDCMTCSFLRPDTVLRTHSYKENSNTTYYVVAWQMSPGNVSFEASVAKNGDNFTLIHPTNTISEYNRRGDCVVNPNDRQFCVCKPVKCTGKQKTKTLT